MGRSRLNWGLCVSIFLHSLLMAVPMTITGVPEFKEIELFVMEEKPVVQERRLIETPKAVSISKTIEPVVIKEPNPVPVCPSFEEQKVENETGMEPPKEEMKRALKETPEPFSQPPLTSIPEADRKEREERELARLKEEEVRRALAAERLAAERERLAKLEAERKERELKELARLKEEEVRRVLAEKELATERERLAKAASTGQKDATVESRKEVSEPVRSPSGIERAPLADKRKEENATLSQKNPLQPSTHHDKHHESSGIAQEEKPRAPPQPPAAKAALPVQQGDSAGDHGASTSPKQTHLPGDVIGFGSGDKPRFLHREMPVYPMMARRFGKEGKVVLRLTIDEKGNLLNVEVLEKAGYGFTEAAVEAAKKSTFLPAKKDGKPIPCRAILPVKFQLKGN